jgi:CRISPR-associated protein Cmr1
MSMTAQLLPRMVKQTYTVRFVTPAFLGDAEQNGAWRTPPFKALLRQWWRVAVAKDYGYDHRRLREAEGRLFGNAWLKKPDGKLGASQSLVRLRLDTWRPGKLQSWPIKDPRLTEVKNPVGAHLYLGYGPLNNEKGKGTVLKMNASLQEGDSIQLTLIFPVEAQDDLVKTLCLIQKFGSLGGRSRNGWGSVEFNGATPPICDSELPQTISRTLTQCLTLDWPHALGKDAKGLLLWETSPCRNWSEAMRALALIKIRFRTALSFGTGFSLRHLLAYPVTKHDVQAWDRPPPPARLANQLRFKVARRGKGVVGIAYHLPCTLPKSLLIRLSSKDQQLVSRKQQETWETVHAVLDDSKNGMHRFKGA